MKIFIIIIVIFAFIMVILNIVEMINAKNRLTKLQKELDKRSDELKKKLLRYSITLKNENKNS